MPKDMKDLQGRILMMSNKIDANFQLPAFSDYVIKHKLSKGKHDLYIALLTFCCRSGGGEFIVNLNDLSILTKLRKNTISVYRQSLCDDNLIEYLGDNKYILMPLYQLDREFDSQVDYKLDNQVSRQAVENTDKSHKIRINSDTKNSSNQVDREFDNQVYKEIDYQANHQADNQSKTSSFAKQALDMWGIKK